MVVVRIGSGRLAGYSVEEGDGVFAARSRRKAI
jgi:hypothetical protein